MTHVNGSLNGHGPMGGATNPHEEHPGIGRPTGSSLEHSILPLERGPNGDSVPRRISYGPSVTGGVDLDQMEYAAFLQEVAKEDPLLAAYLRSVQQDHVRPQFQRLAGVRAEVDEELAGLRMHAEGRDLHVDRVITDVTDRRDEAIAPFVQLVDTAHASLSEAQLSAADASSKVGACHDPLHLDEAAIVRVERLSEAEAAWKLKVPFGKTATRMLLPTWLSWLGTVVCGCLIGLSAALASGALKANELFKEPNLGGIVASCLVGIFAIAIFLRGAIRQYSLFFAESHFTEQPRRRQVAWFLLLISVALFLGGAVIGMDRQGILRAAQSHAAFQKSGVDVSPLMWWIVAAACSTAYCLYGLAEGLLKGRQDPINNAVQGFVEDDFRSRVEARRSNPDVQEALRALSHVLEKKRANERAVLLLQEIRDPFDALIERAEAQRLEWPLEWTPAMKHRVEDARENLAGIHVEMNALVSDFLARRSGQVASVQGGKKK